MGYGSTEGGFSFCLFIIFYHLPTPPLRPHQIEFFAQNNNFIAQDGGGFEIEVFDRVGHLIALLGDKFFWIFCVLSLLD